MPVFQRLFTICEASLSGMVSDESFNLYKNSKTC